MRVQLRSKNFLVLALLTTAGMAPIVSGGEDEAPTAEEIAAAGAKFRKSCANCHVPPDLAFAVDRAWLEQVKDTA